MILNLESAATVLVSALGIGVIVGLLAALTRVSGWR